LQNTAKGLLSLLRIKHWIKNVIIFSPPFFAGRLDLLFTTSQIAAFFSFCLVASAVYIINDLMDIESDKIHPVKCKRALASGLISKKSAIIFLIFILLMLSILVFCIKSTAPFIIAYFLLNVAYSFKLKEIAIIDVSCIALGFVLRVLDGGAAAGNLLVSQWLVTVVFLITIAIAFAKRRDDLLLADGNQGQALRKSLEGYSINFLNIATSLSLSITLTAYIIYTISPEVVKRIGSDKVYVTAFFVFIGIMRYLQIILVEEKSGSPVDVFWKDRFIQFAILGWITSFTILLYGRSI